MIHRKYCHLGIYTYNLDRVLVKGVRGYPPPSTTKLAIFYKGGWQCGLTMNATGYVLHGLSSRKSFQLIKLQLCHLQKNMIFWKLESSRNSKSGECLINLTFLEFQSFIPTTIFCSFKANSCTQSWYSGKHPTSQ